MNTNSEISAWAACNIKRGGYVTNGKTFAESLMVERGIEWITRAHVNKVEAGKIHYETMDGSFHEQEFDFSMLIPPFAGVGLKAYNKPEEDISSQIFAPNGFMKVDADYTPRLIWNGVPRTGQRRTSRRPTAIYSLSASLSRRRI